MIKTATRISKVQEYYFSSKLKEVAQLNSIGHEVINLGIGSPDLPPHPQVIDALKKSVILTNSHGYQSYRGNFTLRDAFANWYDAYYQVTLNPETEILPLLGSKEGIMHISMTYLETGDQVLIPNPGYPAYKACTELAGATVQYYDLTAENNWQPQLDEIEKSNLSKVKIMWVNYPHMPTGANAEKGLYKKLIAFGEKHKILICHDNPYSFILTESTQSILQAGFSDYVLELNSLSKSHNMAGWRVGMIAAKATHINNLLKFKSNMDSGMFKPVQLAAIQALQLKKEWYNLQNEEYHQRKIIATRIVQTLDCIAMPNQTGLFIWAKAPSKIRRVDQWTDKMLHEAKVFIVPGFIFGSTGEKYIRISLCASQEQLKEALLRIQKWQISYDS
jgi:aspartate/methionine/tyrosine aminotransferase